MFKALINQATTKTHIYNNKNKTSINKHTWRLKLAHVI